MSEYVKNYSNQRFGISEVLTADGSHWSAEREEIVGDPDDNVFEYSGLIFILDREKHSRFYQNILKKTTKIQERTLLTCCGHRCMHQFHPLYFPGKKKRKLSSRLDIHDIKERTWANTKKASAMRHPELLKGNTLLVTKASLLKAACWFSMVEVSNKRSQKYSCRRASKNILQGYDTNDFLFPNTWEEILNLYTGYDFSSLFPSLTVWIKVVILLHEVH